MRVSILVTLTIALPFPPPPYSPEGGNTITFTDPETAPAAFGSSPPTVQKRNVCVVTGQPARYLDPVTGHPYASVAAFKKIREEAGIV